uniref:hypothetical protein n=1 Tax=Aquiflexum sp. TaxID=1872584 RepID=UPI003593E1DC
MKTLRFIFNTAILAMFSIGILTAQSNDNAILNTNEITVKPGHNAQFIEGVKQFKACYLENGGTNNWSMWHRQQGDANVYILSGFMAKWAEMDADDASTQACYLTYLNHVFQHIEKQN